MVRAFVPREPFQGSEWGERTPGATSDSGPGRGRRALIVVLGALALAVAGFGAANLGGLSLAGDAGRLEMAAGAIVKPVKRIHTEQREMIRKALNAPFVLGISRERLDAIAECESGGDPRAKSADGLYRGKYQFHRGTWASVGGVGDPARASELEQDRRAAMLIKQSGSNPWPVCGA
jgi:hypothetical protein